MWGLAGQKRIARVPVMAIRFQNLEVFPEWVEDILGMLSSSHCFKVVPAWLRDPENGRYLPVEVNPGEFEFVVAMHLEGLGSTVPEELLYTVYHQTAHNNGVVADRSLRMSELMDERKNMFLTLRRDLELVARLHALVS